MPHALLPHRQEEVPVPDGLRHDERRVQREGRKRGEGELRGREPGGGTTVAAGRTLRLSQERAFAETKWPTSAGVFEWR